MMYRLAASFVRGSGSAYGGEAALGDVRINVQGTNRCEIQWKAGSGQFSM